MNHNLKLIIIGSLVVLVLASAGIGLYVWNMGRTTSQTSQTNNSGNSSKSSSEPAVAKQESVKSVTITPEMRDANGNVDLNKVLQNN